MKYCPECGARVSPGHSVCYSCGSKIDYAALRRKYEEFRRKRFILLIIIGLVLIFVIILLEIFVPALRSVLTVILATIFTILAFAIVLFVMYYYSFYDIR
jgi:uncharacterized membrane protein YvbJ